MDKTVLRLSTECTDKATGLVGTLTHWIMNMGGHVEYLFQPKGLNEEGQPLKKLYLCQERLSVKSSDYEHVDIPFEILGTQVSDKASGFTGMAISFIRHINGCFHVDVQPAGVLPEKGIPIRSCDFDLRMLTGEKIVALTEQEHKESVRSRPSPSEIPERRTYGE